MAEKMKKKENKSNYIYRIWVRGRSMSHNKIKFYNISFDDYNINISKPLSPCIDSLNQTKLHQNYSGLIVQKKRAIFANTPKMAII